jgi:hypothetical protein
MPAMSKTLVRDPLAIGSDGTVLVNVAMFDVVKDAAQLFELAVRERGAVFIGIAVDRHDLERLRAELGDAAAQAGYGVAGRRQGRRRSKTPPR